jgi:hypothetical protein
MRFLVVEHLSQLSYVQGLQSLSDLPIVKKTIPGTLRLENILSILLLVGQHLFEVGMHLAEGQPLHHFLPAPSQPPRTVAPLPIGNSEVDDLLELL